MIKIIEWCNHLPYLLKIGPKYVKIDNILDESKIYFK